MVEFVSGLITHLTLAANDPYILYQNQSQVNSTFSRSPLHEPLHRSDFELSVARTHFSLAPFPREFRCTECGPVSTLPNEPAAHRRSSGKHWSDISNSCTLMTSMGSSCGEVTLLLQRLADGDQAARDELAPHVYAELHKLAAFCLRREKPPHTWQTTELLNEAYLKLVGNPDPQFQGRSHFFGVAAQIMRHILTDHARRRRAERHGGKVLIVQLDEALAISEGQVGFIADLDEALNRLEAIHPQAARVVELRFFGGLTEEECAKVLGVSSRTIKRSWMTARAWLFGQLSPNSQ